MASRVGGPGNDTLYGTVNIDTLFGLDGNDYLSAGPGADYLVGGRGADKLVGSSGDDTLVGDNHGNLDNPGPDGADLLYGGSGNDGISGDGGNDYLSGGDGNDVLDGGAGYDRMSGGNGADYLTDSWASAWGDAGDDGLVIGSGGAHGGTGRDWFNLDYASARTVSWTGDADADTFNAGFYTNDGKVSQVTITDFNRAAGDHLTLQADNFATNQHFDQAAVLAAEDTNHDGKLSASDLHVDVGTAGLSIHWGEDIVTVAHLATIDLSMFG